MSDNTRRPYALIETNFILNDPNYYTLPAPARCLYIALWCLAVSERSELIRRPSPSYAALISGSSPNHTAMMIKACADHNLLIERDDWLIIVGVAKKHNKINIKSFSNEKEQSEKVPELSGVKRSEVELNETPPIIPPKGDAPVKPERKVKKETKPTNPDIKTFIDWYFNEHQKRLNQKLVIIGGRDGSLVGSTLKNVSLAELQRRAGIFLESDRSWMSSPTYDIPALIKNINAIDKKDAQKDNADRPFDYPSDNFLRQVREKMARENAKNG